MNVSVLTRFLCRCFIGGIVVSVTLVGVRSAFGESAKQDDPAPVTRLTLHPAGEAQEALKYQFHTSVLDQKKGNAVLQYFMAASMLPDDSDDEYGAKVKELLPMAANELPREDAESLVSAYRHCLHLIDQAVRCDRSDWELPVEDGYNMLLPGLGDFRHLGKVMALRARMQMADGEYDEAADTLRRGFVMGRQIAEGPTLIQDLVGIAMAQLMLREIEKNSQQSGSVNLYWALTTLPRPFVDMREAMENERCVLYFTIPKLRDIETAELTAEQAGVIMDELMVKLSEIGMGVSDKNRLLSAGWVMLHYSDAKEWLKALGKTAEEIEAMPAGQVVLIYQLQQYEQIRDEIFKWFNVPYWQAHERLKKADQQVSEMARQGVRANLFSHLLPALGRAYFLSVSIDRYVAMLRCVEAVRMFAAENDGRLPDSLADITVVPIPLDPVTGEGFVYELVGDVAVLEAPVSPAEKVEQRPRYELVVEKVKN